MTRLGQRKMKAKKKKKKKLKIPHSHCPPGILKDQSSAHPKFILHLGELTQINYKVFQNYLFVRRRLLFILVKVP